MFNIEKVEKGVYRYRGVALKCIYSKIDQDIDVNGGVVDPQGYIVFDSRTKVVA